MSEGAVGFMVLIGLSIGTAVCFHFLIHHYALAIICAAISSDILFQIVVYLHAGYLDPFFTIALVTGGAIALVIAAIIGVPFAFLRRKEQR